MKKYDQLLDSAMALFYRQGFHATGVDQLSQEAQLTKKTLYRYFPTKEALVQAALRQRDQCFMDGLRSRLEAVPVAERPLSYLDFIEDWTREPGFHGCAFINAAAEYPDLADLSHAIAAEHKQGLRDYLTQVCAEAGLAEPSQAAAQLFLLGEGLTVAAQVSGPDEDLLAQARAMAAQLLGKRRKTAHRA
ncbi:TetR family transcriptional regulator [Paucibacter sp. KBW04]|uniref:TetR/AcrR family transcriptional regulator n=1 Tax=Paucibacter sp. KBW04 TaxID=2153361 RepID=UPI000F5627CA|nr:TetR/AcrR family transcriptional regulator [Paucibacter sp. KBW04]RQO60560.1 TetR family transcriptional regulator [Paucibacter sp. KBW04]